MQTSQLPHAENMLKQKKPNWDASELVPSKAHECWYLQHFGPSNATKMYRHERTRSLLLLLLLLLRRLLLLLLLLNGLGEVLQKVRHSSRLGRETHGTMLPTPFLIRGRQREIQSKQPEALQLGSRCSRLRGLGVEVLGV